MNNYFKTTNSFLFEILSKSYKYFYLIFKPKIYLLETKVIFLVHVVILHDSNITDC